MFLEVMTFTWDICSDFETIREADSGDLSNSGVRLLRSLCCNLDTYTTLEWRRHESWSVLDSIECTCERDRLRLASEARSVTAHQLIDCWHSFFFA